MKQIQALLRWGFMWLEGWFDKVFGVKWNPMYALGGLGFFYFWIVAVSGFYVYAFFDTGLTEAYDSVEQLTHEQWYLGGVMRSLHRYASDALVIMMVLHMIREFAFDHYRGPRFFSWISGVPMTWLVIAAGITGYWLVWDQLAQYIAIGSAEWLDWLPIFGEPIARNFMQHESLDDRFFTLLIFLHIALPLILLLVMWIHLQRVAYARWKPARGLSVGTFAMLVGLSFVFPAVSHAPADLDRVPQVLNLDWYYLFAFPLIDEWGAATLWVISFGVTFALMAMPWLPPRRKLAAAVVDLGNCNGCTRCASDCPFGAIMMMPRTDGLPFDRQAVVDADVCVSCGICVGACPTAMPFRRRSDLVPGIDLPELTAAALRDKIHAASAKMNGDNRVLVIGCEHGIKTKKLAGENRAAIDLPCVGMLPPSYIDYILSKGLADGVAIAGCRFGECQYRLGPDWSEDRFEGRRDPHLRKRVPRERLLRLWMAPTEWKDALHGLDGFQAGLNKAMASSGLQELADEAASNVRVSGTDEVRP
ncbi:cytochrome b N-terminal domain-containing protein [Thalassospiraceae bacterium LMO-JJ14]|nr:cytochrome b N-terminal domain-containing protein [Thalassospiraceae bacterium LMO-JJ14]